MGGNMMFEDVLMALNGARYCLEHDVAKGTKEFTVRQLSDVITLMEKMQRLWGKVYDNGQ